MPRKQQNFAKYKCSEPFCAKVVRQDKWPAHCKQEHSFKFRRGEEIQKEVVAVKDKEGKWHSQSLSKVTQMNSSTISTESQCKSQTQSESQAQTGVQTDVTTSVSVQSSQAEATPDDAGMTTSPVIQPPTPAPDNFYCATDDDVTEPCIDQTLNDPTECDLRDPVLYSGRRLKSQDINTLLNAGPCQPDLGYKFPLESGRSFNPDWFLCDMPDTSQYRRNWLSYSISTNKAYCIPCIAFSGPRGSEVWTTTGFDDWRNGSRDVKRHECTAEHRNAEIARLHWRRGKTVCQMARCHNNAIVDDNRKVVSCVIDCVRFLASEMLAFWGDDSAHGKFINLFRLVAKRDPNAAAYLMKIEQTHKDGKRMGVNFISPGNICDILKIMKKMVVEKIVQDIRREKKACIIFDSTQDYSKREASVLLARYMEVDCHGEQRITERLLEVFTTGETSGAVLKECVLDVLKKVKFDIDWIVAQCYDGAGNMRGKYSGMATLIQETCSKAIYIWCHAHRLNLVVNAVARCSNDVKNTLGIIEELYVFMCGHKRNDVFLQEQKQTPGRTVQLKRVSTTRWNSSEAAVDIVLSRYSEVMQALSRMSKAGVYDSETITQATGLRKRLRDIRIIICMHILKMAYHIIGPVSRLLQGISIDLASAAALLSDCKRQFEQLRTNADTEWEKLYQQSAIFASKHGVACELSSVVERRKRKKRMDGELATDESLAGKERMKVETFVTVIDEINEQLRSRFSEQNVTFMKQLSFFTPAGLLCNSQDDVTVDDIRAVCEQYGLSAPDVHKELLDFRSTYRVCCGDVLLDGSMSASEPESAQCLDPRASAIATTVCSDSEESISTPESQSPAFDDELDEPENFDPDCAARLQRQWQNSSFIKPLELLSQLSGFPNLHMLYSIFCCLPVSSASAERALSKLKIVKNRLRTSLSDETLASLLVLASEKDLMMQLTVDDIITRVAYSRPSLKTHLLY